VNISHLNIKLSPIVGALTLAWAAANSGVAWAQTAAEPPAQHQHMGGHAGHAGSGAGFHRRFDDAEKWAKEFDNPERDAWQKPEEVLDALHLQPTSLVADIGAGTGYFSVRIARRVPEGKIFAADSSPTWCAISAPVRSASIWPISRRCWREPTLPIFPSPSTSFSWSTPIITLTTAPVFRGAEIIAASRRAACHHRLQGRFAERSARAPSHSA
jgi:hypothetical protein